jgi:integrase
LSIFAAKRIFAVLAERYLREHARRKKKASSAREDERNLNRDVLPAWGSRKVTEITRRDVIALIDGIVDRGAGVHANRVLALVSKVFNFGIEKAVVELNPAHKVRKPTPELQRERVLTPEEIGKVWQAFDEEPATSGTILKLLLLTGQRPGEVKGMRWSELDLEAGWWTLPGGRQGRTKNKQVQRIPLVGEALRLLVTLREGKEQEAVHVFAGGRTGAAHFVGLHKPKRRAVKRSGVDFQSRDLRRTLASGLGELRFDRTVIKKILNHTDGSVTAIYDRYDYDREKREALAKWDRQVRAIVSGKPAPAKVVPIHA